MQRQFQYVYNIQCAQNEIKTVTELNSVVPPISTFGELRSMALLSHSRRLSVVLRVVKTIA
jgi:hypothetical protein